MKILITGSSKGIGLAVAKFFIEKNYEVIGIDKLPSSISDIRYTHYQVDVRNKEALPSLKGINYIFNNAGVQNEDDIEVNLVGAINIAEK